MDLSPLPSDMLLTSSTHVITSFGSEVWETSVTAAPPCYTMFRGLPCSFAMPVPDVLAGIKLPSAKHYEVK